MNTASSHAPDAAQGFQHTLIWWGLALFLLGLLTGLMLALGAPIIVNPRGVLAGHLEGVSNGMFLMLVGLLFRRFQLSRKAAAIVVALLMYGTYANWIATTLSGIWGTSETTPIAGLGHHASPAREQFITVILVSVALTMIVGVAMLLVGARRRIQSAGD